MREWISGRNPVFEALSAGRRHFFRLRIAQGIQETGRVQEIINLCLLRKLPVERVSRSVLDTIALGNQGIALETSAYPYSNLPDVLDLAATLSEPPLILILDTLQDPQNLGTLLRTADVTGVHGVLLPYRRTATVTGLGLGQNARAALITRGLAELARLGVALGGRAETVMGLTGAGDLILTATGDLSRNRRVGLQLAAGKPLAIIVAELGHVAEGVRSARAALARASAAGVDMPITAAVDAAVSGRLTPPEAVELLLSRDPKAEG